VDKAAFACGLALGRGNMGGGKYYDRVEDCKAFAALPTLLTMGAL
jgi:predicted MFS family arabinose efflux permease